MAWKQRLESAGTEGMSDSGCGYWLEPERGSPCTLVLSTRLCPGLALITSPALLPAACVGTPGATYACAFSPVRPSHAARASFLHAKQPSRALAAFSFGSPIFST